MELEERDGDVSNVKVVEMMGLLVPVSRMPIDSVRHAFTHKHTATAICADTYMLTHAVP